MRRSDPEGQPANHFRMPERLFFVNGEWWFATREGDEGPFPNESQARTALARYSATQEAVETMVAERAKEVEQIRATRPKVDSQIWDRQLDVL